MTAARPAKGKEPVRQISTVPSKPKQKPKPQRRRPDPIDVVTEIRGLSISNESPTRGLGSSSRSSPITPPRTPRTPRIVISAPEEECKRPTQRRKSGSGTGGVKRPLLPRKSATAPAGAFRAIPTPQPPRRAISARVGKPDEKYNGGFGREDLESPIYPQVSKYGTSESRSIINRRKSNKKWADRNALRVRGNTLKLPAPPDIKKYELIASELRGSKRVSFSEKARVKETLKSKKLSPLNTNIVDFTERDLPDTPMSLVSTPRELYGHGGDQHLRPQPLPSATAAAGLQRRTALRPATSNNRVKHFSLPLSPHVQRRDSLRRSNSSQNLNSPGRLSGRNVYHPGPIRLGVGTWESSLRSTYLAVTQSGNEMTHEESGWPSDSSVLDEIAEYFESFGTMPATATEDVLDRYWEEADEDEQEPEPEPEESQAVTEIKPVAISPRSPDWKARIRLGLDEAPLSSPTTPIRAGGGSLERAPSSSSNGALSLSSMMTRQQTHGKEDKDKDKDKDLAARNPRATRRLRQFLKSGRSSKQ